MLVLGLNRICEWCQITTGRGTYTCPLKIIDGETYFKFKNVWHKVSDYIAENATELVQEKGITFSRPYMK